MRVLTVFGTRPEATKLAPVILRLKAEPQIESLVCVTGQHRELLDPVLELFSIQPDIDLKLMKQDQSLAQLTADLFASLDPVYRETKPDWILVQGDTTTVMAAALGGFYRGIRVAHVEAGLRTRDRWQPFPEEINRRVAGAAAELHFAPTAWARANLLAEGVDPNTILVTGNTAIDALQLVLPRPETEQARQLLTQAGVGQGGKLVLVTAHRRENHGEGLRSICEAVRRLSARYVDSLSVIWPVHPNPHVHDLVHQQLGGLGNVILCQPLDYLTLVQVMRAAHLVLTDSGGIQEEATALGKPTLVLRQVTERPEGVEAGVLKLVGTDPQRIFEESVRLIDDAALYTAMAHQANPYGDGHAAERIVRALLERA